MIDLRRIAAQLQSGAIATYVDGDPGAPRFVVTRDGAGYVLRLAASSTRYATPEEALNAAIAANP